MTTSEIVQLALMGWTSLMLTIVFVLQRRRDKEDRDL